MWLVRTQVFVPVITLHASKTLSFKVEANTSGALINFPF
jgi:hypothetical protein